MNHACPYDLDDLDHSIEPCGSTENVVHYPCIVVVVIVWRETTMR